MSDEPIPPTDLAPPPVMLPPVMPPPVVTPAPLPPPKSVTPAWVFTLLKTLLAVLVITLVTVGMILLHRETGWEGIWKVTLIGTCGLFAILSVLVIVGGALDVRKLLRRLRERECSDEADSGD
jgi:hypothetical protein